MSGNIHTTQKVAGSTSHQFTDSDKAVSPPKKRAGEIVKPAPASSNSCSDSTEQVYHYMRLSVVSIIIKLSTVMNFYCNTDL